MCPRRTCAQQTSWMEFEKQPMPPLPTPPPPKAFPEGRALRWPREARARHVREGVNRTANSCVLFGGNTRVIVRTCGQP